MKKSISRTFLASVAAVAVTLSLPTIQTFGPDHFSSAAFARGGSDDGGGSSGSGGSGSGGSGGSGNSGSSHSGGSDDHGGSGSGHGGDDHSGRSGHDDGNDDHGRGRGRDDGAEHDQNDDNPGQRRGGRNDNRPEVTLSVSQASLTGLLNGSLAAVDQLGRRLEVEVELEHGTSVVVAHPHRGDFVRNPGAITSVTIVPASAQ